MYGYVYIITNLIDGKKYIGQHRCAFFDESYRGSGKIISKAIDKYGWENFSSKILDPVNGIKTCCDSKEELDKAEEFYIDYYDAVNSDLFYNLKSGGTGGDTFSGLPQEDKLFISKKMSSIHKGSRWMTKEDVCKRIKQPDIEEYIEQGWEFNYSIDRPLPDEVTIRKRAESKRIKVSEETRKKIIDFYLSEDNIGVAETSKKFNYSYGVVKKILQEEGICLRTLSQVKTGKKLSEETKKQQSLSRKGKPKTDAFKKAVSEKFSKKIYCKELDKVFNSGAEANLFFNRPRNSDQITFACRSGKPYKGYHFTYKIPENSSYICDLEDGE